MTRYIFRRILGLIPVLVGISLLTFTLTRVIPADPALLILGERATPESRAQLREVLGLNEPLFFNPAAVSETGNPAAFLDSQYFNFVGGALTGNLGRSYFTRIDVRDGLAQRFPATFELAVTAMIFALVIGIPAGVAAALYRGTAVDTLLMIGALSGVSFPVFWLAIILIYIFSINLGWLPPSQRLDVSLSLQPVTGLYVLDGLLRGRPDISWDALKHLILPGVALGTIPLAIVVRMTRSSMLEVLGQDYVRTAKAKGLRQRLVVNKHALRNALLPVVTVVGLSFGTLLSGAILTETVFSWPGIGKWIYDAISARDYPIIQGGVLFVAFVFVVVNLLIDLSYALIDPRIQYT
ncbi:MAG: Dipeptide transport system permease protein DppB [uncultured Truepera sp.]|uniref:Dipeptide transport system permease protein DppB n=1 Tax=uncultured Truepera sp. TaxID=543023 RepID=A0A6J4VGV9_9DEIN|nr:MAG: Dipeptide transport system permease protein DppB [uncultured Truepera sp.]